MPLQLRFSKMGPPEGDRSRTWQNALSTLRSRRIKITTLKAQGKVLSNLQDAALPICTGTHSTATQGDIEPARVRGRFYP